MKQAIILSFVIACLSCKKETATPTAPYITPVVVTPEPEGKQVEGEWIVYDSIGVNYDDPAKPDWDYVSTHTSTVFDSTHFDGQDSITRWYMSNFWGNGEVCEVYPESDSLLLGTVPKCNGVPVISKSETSVQRITLCKSNNYFHFYEGRRTSLQARGYCTIKMTKKP